MPTTVSVWVLLILVPMVLLLLAYHLSQRKWRRVRAALQQLGQASVRLTKTVAISDKKVTTDKVLAQLEEVSDYIANANAHILYLIAYSGTKHLALFQSYASQAEERVEKVRELVKRDNTFHQEASIAVADGLRTISQALFDKTFTARAKRTLNEALAHMARKAYEQAYTTAVEVIELATIADARGNLVQANESIKEAREAGCPKEIVDSLQRKLEAALTALHTDGRERARNIAAWVHKAARLAIAHEREKAQQAAAPTAARAEAAAPPTGSAADPTGTTAAPPTGTAGGSTEDTARRAAGQSVTA